MARYVSIWFPYLLTDYVVRKKSELRDVAFVVASPERGRLLVKAANALAVKKGIHTGMVVADCKAIFPDLEVIEAEAGRAQKLLRALAEWCIGYTPFSSVDSPDGLILDGSGCAHLWGGEQKYLESMRARLGNYGYHVQVAMADTIGAAWAMARFGSGIEVVKPGSQHHALIQLPAAALRLEEPVLAKLKKLGLDRVGSFIAMPHSALRRRFGPTLPHRISQALGHQIEIVQPVKPIEPYQERLPTLELVCTATGIEIALEQLLEMLCARFEKEGVGLRSCVFKAYRIDGDVQQIDIGTGHPSKSLKHLFKLFEHKIGMFEPALGFELFILEAPKVEPVTNEQGAIWDASGKNDMKIAELLDRVASKTDSRYINRYLPAEHYWPERSIKQAASLHEEPATYWRSDLPRPIHLLTKPEIIEVAVRIPDYPPIQFSYKGERFEVAKADGPERIEQEWWIENGHFRDYYCIEDTHGARFWLFRLGPYDDNPKWFIHGFFA
ncbi:DNA polymerase Y family protein [Flavobacterium sp.]|uniref:Y-family DNA polymerase n=1 Tax=Flavobacterium sp. TaxID=239 RepID=UPI0025BAD26E|nr:DNA polymerase Y family protein [Flavobacterium sp.]